MRLVPRVLGDESRRRETMAWVLAGLCTVVAGLFVLGLLLLKSAYDAQAAKSDLMTAKTALASDDLDSARSSVENARGHIDSAQGSAQGLPGMVWSKVPVAGTAVSDAQHLVQALDDATAVAEIGVDLYPSTAGDDATLFVDGRVDEQTLDQVIAGAHAAADHVRSADDALNAVQGTTPIVGATIAANRDQALDQISPLVDGIESAEPMLDELPTFMGFEGRRKYLIAMLNPSELRYSGGAALAFAPMTWDQGKLEIGKAFPLVANERLRTPHTWRGVRGNIFHVTDSRIPNATFAPSWSVSGEELLRSWKSATGHRYAGLMAVDVVTLAKVLDATGPVAVTGVGRVTGSTLTKTLIGSYDDYYPDPTVQDATFATVTAALQNQLFSGGGYASKGRAIKSAAEGRHLAIYMRDDEVQKGFAAAGFSGDLATPDGDYLGVFTQSAAAAKVDYYQRRHLDLDVTLGADGTAANELDVLIRNDTPPYAIPGTDTPPSDIPNPDPLRAYFTRWDSLNASVFVPGGASMQSFSVDGQAWDGDTHTFYDHSFVDGGTVIAPAGSAHVLASYEVPGAAQVEKNGELTYRLSVDPQGTVNPATADVTVHLPNGFRATGLPEGWSAQGSTLTFHTDALQTSEQWTITLEPTA